MSKGIRPIRHTICGTPLVAVQNVMSSNPDDPVKETQLVCTKCKCAVPLRDTNAQGAVCCVAADPLDPVRAPCSEHGTNYEPTCDECAYAKIRRV